MPKMHFFEHFGDFQPGYDPDNFQSTQKGICKLITRFLSTSTVFYDSFAWACTEKNIWTKVAFRLLGF